MDNPLDNIADEFGYSCPECGAELECDETVNELFFGASCCYGINSEPLNMTCTNHICWGCLYRSCEGYQHITDDTGISYSGWFIDQGRGEYYCPDHAAEAQAADERANRASEAAFQRAWEAKRVARAAKRGLTPPPSLPQLGRRNKS